MTIINNDSDEFLHTRGTSLRTGTRETSLKCRAEAERECLRCFHTIHNRVLQ